MHKPFSSLAKLTLVFVEQRFKEEQERYQASIREIGMLEAEQQKLDLDNEIWEFDQPNRRFVFKGKKEEKPK